MEKCLLNDIYDVVAEQVMIMKDQSTATDNKTFLREIAKTKEMSNAVGKLVAITAQQLWANELGAQISVPGLGIEEGQIQLQKESRINRMIGNGR